MLNKKIYGYDMMCCNNQGELRPVRLSVNC